MLREVAVQQTDGNGLSTVPLRHIQAIAPISFEASSNEESTLGVVVTRVPEAALILLFGVGLVFFRDL